MVRERTGVGLDGVLLYYWGGGDGGLTWLSVRVGRVESLEWRAGVFLDEDHCVAAFVAGGYLYSCALCLDVQGHDHTWLC